MRAVEVNGRTIRTRAVMSNANLKATIFNLIGEEHFDRGFVDEARAVRLNNSSTQVYMALKADEQIDEATGDLLFSSTAPLFRTELLLEPRHHEPHLFVLLSAHAARGPAAVPDRFEHERQLSTTGRISIAKSTKRASSDLIETTLDALDKYVPNVRERIDHVEASTPLTFEHYTKHLNGASFGTKFEGLAVSRALPQQIAGLYHAGSVGIIMSGWLGAMNYGVIVAMTWIAS